MRRARERLQKGKEFNASLSSNKGMQLLIVTFIWVVLNWLVMVEQE